MRERWREREKRERERGERERREKSEMFSLFRSSTLPPLIAPKRPDITSITSLDFDSRKTYILY